MDKKTNKTPSEKVNIHEGHRQRLKESVLKDPSLASLSDVEVLEYILMFVIPRKDTNPLAHLLLNKFGSLYYVFTLDYLTLIEIPEITQNAAHLISNLFSLIRRIYQTKENRDRKIKNFKDSIDVFSPYFILRETEYIYIACLDVHESVISVELIASGNTANVFIDKNKLVKTAMLYHAKSIVIAHNHPAGDYRPSQEDIVATWNLASSLNALGINLKDHIIFSDAGYFSFYHAGILQNNHDIAYSIEEGCFQYNETRLPDMEYCIEKDQ